MSFPTRPALFAAAASAAAAAVAAFLVPVVAAVMAGVAAAAVMLVLGQRTDDVGQRTDDVGQGAEPGPAHEDRAARFLHHAEEALLLLADVQRLEDRPDRLRLLYAADAAVARAAGVAEDALAADGNSVMGSDPTPMTIMDAIRVGLSGIDELGNVPINASPLISIDGVRARPFARIIGRVAEHHGPTAMPIEAFSTGEGATVIITTHVPTDAVIDALAAASGVTVATDGTQLAIGIDARLLVSTGPADHQLAVPSVQAPEAGPTGNDGSASGSVRFAAAGVLPVFEDTPPVPSGDHTPPERPGDHTPPERPDKYQADDDRPKRGLMGLFGRGHRAATVSWSTSLRPGQEPSATQLAGFVNDYVPARPEPDPEPSATDAQAPTVPAFTKVTTRAPAAEVPEDYVPPTVDGPLMDIIADLPSSVPAIRPSDKPARESLPVRDTRAATPATLMAELASELEGLL